MVIRAFVVLGSLGAVAAAQVPAGVPYDPALHPNPIVTFVGNTDFRDSSYADAHRMAGVELLGPSGLTARRDSIGVAESRTLGVQVLGRPTEVLTFPVVRQGFVLDTGGDLVLYAFRNPRTDLPPADAEGLLNQEALGEADRNPEERRFGPAPPPEELSIRGRPALLFEEPERRTLFWQEGGVCYVAESSLAAEELFLLVEDLL